MTWPAELREWVRDLRGTTRGQVLLTFVIAAGVAGFVAASGGFGSHQISQGMRFLVLEMAAAGAAGMAVLTREAMARLGVALRGRAARAAIGACVMTPPTAILCWGLAIAFQGGDAPPIAEFVVPTFVAVAACAALDQLVRRDLAPQTVAVARSDPFADRLPHGLRGAELLAVAAEDHYLRVITSRGEALIHMRFGDALAALQAHDGARTHRSWWVARTAVVAVKRGGGRAQLTLRDRRQVPASRRFARKLREMGWY